MTGETVEEAFLTAVNVVAAVDTQVYTQNYPIMLLSDGFILQYVHCDSFYMFTFSSREGYVIYVYDLYVCVCVCVHVKDNAECCRHI